ncbi:MAG: UDP-N-acetylmuramoyl-tripeptide--D-alanyl-D-alanine ligase [Planctomycetes bacterium]|nr:UDP-N-acetylmuramoyl-tripeptide--D-alanyl-D-alanine ligase [Planctomycetota bacterium]
MLEHAIAEALTGGQWHGATREAVIHGAATDSRQVQPGCLFACLPGARVDGHDFAATAVGDGAAMILASKLLTAPVPVLVVADVSAALGVLAAEFRRRLTGVRWIGVTGSNGKTTVKELIAAACATSGPVHATAGNLNNHLGLPITVLNTPAHTRFAVIEMGANHAGEIAALAAISQPEIGVITTIGPAHLEGFGSLDGVARAKSELFAALPADAPAILGVTGLDEIARRHGTTAERLLDAVRAQARGRRLMLVGSPENPVDGAVESDGVTLRTLAGSARVQLLGAHNLTNAAVAVEAAIAAGVAPRAALAGLQGMHPVAGRLTARRAGAHLVIDDTYNANPGSMIAGLQVLAARTGPRLAVLGGMGELGSELESGHRLVGAEAARLGLPLVVVGPRAAPIAAAYRDAGGPSCVEVPSREAAVSAVLITIGETPTTILVKASRSSGLEIVVEGLIAACGGPC